MAVNNNANRYQFYGMIGQGRIGDVYRAMDTVYQRECAIKLLHKDTLSAEFLQYFNNCFPQDAASVARLNNAGIIKIFDCTLINGAPAWAMEMLSGNSYQNYCGTPIPENQAAAMLIPVADALAYAHQFNLFHGNLKPSNILINASNMPVLTDFGQTRWLSENGHGFGNFEAQCGIGSPEYLAPEQAQGAPIDARTDVYSLGIILYELVTGRRPFSAVNPLETMAHQVNDQIPSPRYMIPNCSSNLEQLLYQATAKNPAQRMSTMGEFGYALRNLSSSASQTGYYPPASYMNQNQVEEEDEDNEGESPIIAKVKNFLSVKRNLYISAGVLALLIGLIVFLIVSGTSKKKEETAVLAATAEFEASATQEAIEQEEIRMTEDAEAALEIQNVQATEDAVQALMDSIVPTGVTLDMASIPTLDIVSTAIPTTAASSIGGYMEQEPIDGSELITGEGFKLSFHIQNNGTNDWDMNYKLVFVSGTNFGRDGVTEAYVDEIIYGNRNGASWISIPCTAPWTPGTYTGYWKLVDAAGNTVEGCENLSLTINVVSGELTPTPVPEGAVEATPVEEDFVVEG